MRLVAITSYDGSRFFGIQTQQGVAVTVMESFERAMAKCGIFQKAVYAGRTDAGVHATYQPIAFDVDDFWAKKIEAYGGEILLKTLNSKLPDSIKIKKLYEANSDFHPRFDAVWRKYRYIVSLNKKNPFLADYVTYIEEKPNIKKLKNGMSLFVGTHDFAMFRKKGSDEKTTVRIIKNANVYEKNGFLIFVFVGNGFLRSQIRLSVNAVLQAGLGGLEIPELNEQIENKRQHITKPALPNGLYLCGVSYGKPLKRIG